MQRKYETVCIVRPDAGDEIVKGIIAKAKAALEAGGGTLTKLDEWGRRKLAYAIAKKHEGYYFVMSYSCEPAVSKEAERVLRLNEDVVRHQTIVIEEKKINPKKLKRKKKPAATTTATAPAAAPAEGGAANG